MVTTETLNLKYVNATGGSSNGTIINTTPYVCGETQDSGVGAGTIAGAVVGSFLLLVIILLILYAAKKRGLICSQRNLSDVKFTSKPNSGSEWESDMYHDADVVKRDKNSQHQRDASKVQNIYVINHTTNKDRNTASGPYLDFSGSMTNQNEANYEDVSGDGKSSEEQGTPANKLNKGQRCENYDDVAISSSAFPKQRSIPMSKSTIGENKETLLTAPTSEIKTVHKKPDTDDGSGDNYFVLEKDQQQSDNNESYYIYDFNTTEKKVKRAPVKTDSEESDHFYLELENGKIDAPSNKQEKPNLRPDMTRMNSKEDAYSYAVPDENCLNLPKYDKRPNTFPSHGNKELPVADDDDLYTYCEY